MGFGIGNDSMVCTPSNGNLSCRQVPAKPGAKPRQPEPPTTEKKTNVLASLFGFTLLSVSTAGSGGCVPVDSATEDAGKNGRKDMQADMTNVREDGGRDTQPSHDRRISDQGISDQGRDKPKTDQARTDQKPSADQKRIDTTTQTPDAGSFDKKVVKTPDKSIPVPDKGKLGDLKSALDVTPVADKGKQDMKVLDMKIIPDMWGCGKTFTETKAPWQGFKDSTNLDQTSISTALLIASGTSGIYRVELNSQKTNSMFTKVSVDVKYPNSSAKISINTCTNNTNGGLSTCTNWTTAALYQMNSTGTNKYKIIYNIKSPPGQYCYLEFTLSGSGSGEIDGPHLEGYELTYCTTP